MSARLSTRTNSVLICSGCGGGGGGGGSDGGGVGGGGCGVVPAVPACPPVVAGGVWVGGGGVWVGGGGGGGGGAGRGTSGGPGPITRRTAASSAKPLSCTRVRTIVPSEGTTQMVPSHGT